MLSPRLRVQKGARIVTPKMGPRSVFPGKSARPEIKKRHLFFSSWPRGEYFQAGAMWNWAAWLHGPCRPQSAWLPQSGRD